MTRLLPAALHTTGRPSSTAQWTALGRALELLRPEPIVADPFAPVFLSRPTAAMYCALAAAEPAVRRAERLEFAGLATSALARHRFVDDHLLAALATTNQVLVLGAGYDSRAYRFAPQIDERPVFEVDLAPISRRKAAVVAAHRELFGPTRVRRVEIDFRTDLLTERLTESGFAAGAPTFVVWEGVSMYLGRSAVEGTLAALDGIAGRGSVLAADFWQQVDGAGGSLRIPLQRSMRLIGEPVTFPLRAGAAPALLEAHGFAPEDLAEADVLTARYATDGRRCDPGMYLVAARLG